MEREELVVIDVADPNNGLLLIQLSTETMQTLPLAQFNPRAWSDFIA